VTPTSLALNGKYYLGTRAKKKPTVIQCHPEHAANGYLSKQWYFWEITGQTARIRERSLLGSSGPAGRVYVSAGRSSRIPHSFQEPS
jgi:hypothetical protein